MALPAEKTVRKKENGVKTVLEDQLLRRKVIMERVRAGQWRERGQQFQQQSGADDQNQKSLSLREGQGFLDKFLHSLPEIGQLNSD